MIRALVTAAGGVLLLGLVAPLVNVAFLRVRIQNALEQTLGRKVKIGRVHLTLFAGPGFSLDDVTIAEDPRFGLEPFAYVETLEARIRPDKLLLGRLQIASLRFERPSLNLVKQADGTWNVVAMMERLSAPRRAPLNIFPALVLSDGRLDFKLGIRKTTFYVAQADLELYPQRSGSITMHFAGSPARTDRSGTGFGHLRGEVTWVMGSGGPDPLLNADLALDPSDLSELITLLEGYDIGLQGTVSTQAHVEGPISDLAITGQLRVEDVHRWDLLPSQGEDWRIRYRGAMDLVEHRFGLETLPSQENQPTPVALRLRVNNFLSQANWGFLARLDAVPAGRLLPLVGRLGVPVPDGMSLEGSLSGVIGYSSRGGFSGQIGFSNLTASLPGVSKLHTDSGTATIAANTIHIEPMEVGLGGDNTVAASAEYNPSTRGLEVTLDTQSAPIAALAPVLHSWFTDAPLLSQFRAGEVTGPIRYTHMPGGQASWGGRLDIADGSLELPELAVPVSNVSGRLTIDTSNYSLSGVAATIDGLQVTGDYRYTATGPRREHLHVRLEQADLGQIENAMAPTLRSSTLLARLRLGRRSLPAWMTGRNLEGDLAIDELTAAGAPLGPLKTHAVWEGANVQLTSLALDFGEAHVTAKGSISLTGIVPRYRLTGSAEGLAWKGGSVSLTGKLETTGTGNDALRNVRASGKLNGADWRLAAGVEFETVTGNFSFSLADGWPALRLSALKATQGDEAWDGTAASESDGKLVFELVSGRRQMHVVSSVNPQPAESSAAAAAAGALRP